ncbi:MAG: hypothetical protein AAF747_11235, partial [Planctomycetota bacterium]
RHNNLYDLPKGGVMLAEPRPEMMARAIISIIDDDQRFNSMSAFGNAFMAKRDLAHGFEQFVSAVDDLLAGRTDEWTARTRALTTMYHGPPGPTSPIDNGLPAQIVESRMRARMNAHAELAELEASRAWQLVQRVRKSAVYRAYAGARFGPNWDKQSQADLDPAAKLNAIQTSRTYKMLRSIKQNSAYQTARSIISKNSQSPRP